MNRFFEYIIIGFCSLSSMFFSSCKKDEKRTPIVITTEVWGIYQRSAVVGGKVISDGGSAITSRGFCWSTSGSPTIIDTHNSVVGDIGVFQAVLERLVPASTYYIRAFASNKFATGYGEVLTFESGLGELPEISTERISSINSTSAVSGGIISYDGGSDITSRGVCWSTGANPTLDNPHSIDKINMAQFTSQIQGLSESTTYYVRAYATNLAGTGYGDQRTFKTLSDSASTVLFSPLLFSSSLVYGTVKDVAYNVYKTIQIGSQTWMAENLKTVLFSDGSQIANNSDIKGWPNYTLDAFVWYNNDVSFQVAYGPLYNWYAVNTGKLCPAGWHIPSKLEFETLITVLGGENSAGAELKESGNVHWLPPNALSDNQSGFTAIPAGHVISGEFKSFRAAGSLWSANESNSGSSFTMLLEHNSSSATIKAVNKTDGMSVRCVKN
jgi:uncharacterized protein (TIGR02145 family)